MWRVLSRNLPVKLTSLALAVLLWAMVAGQRVSSKTIRVPLVMPELPDTLMNLVEVPENVEVTFRDYGRRLFWFRLQPPRMRPTFPLQVMNEAETRALKQEYLDLPRQFQGSIVTIKPELIQLHIVEAMSKELPVRPSLGKPPVGRWQLDEAAGLRAEPPAVTARGPRESLAKMSEVRTEFLHLHEAQAGGERALGLKSEDPHVVFEPDRVTVHYEIIAKPSAETLPRP